VQEPADTYTSLWSETVCVQTSAEVYSIIWDKNICVQTPAAAFSMIWHDKDTSCIQLLDES
jgi:hypothetical protein